MTLRIPLSTTLPGPRPGVVYVATKDGLEMKRVKSRARSRNNHKDSTARKPIGFSRGRKCPSLTARTNLD